MTDTDDPVVKRLLRYGTSLRASEDRGQHDLLAAYHTRSGDIPFAFCRQGLLLNPGPHERFVPYVEVEDAGYYNLEMVERARAAKVSGKSEALSIRLRSGERIDLPVEVRADGMPDLLTIAYLIQQRATIFRSEERRAAGTS